MENHSNSSEFATVLVEGCHNIDMPHGHNFPLASGLLAILIVAAAYLAWAQK